MGQINLLQTDTPQTPQTGFAGIFIDIANSPILVTDDGTQIPLGGTSLEQNIIDALTASQGPTGTNPFVTLAELQSYLGGVTQVVFGGNVQWSGTGLVFNISATGYFIDGVYNELPAGQVTLIASDPTDPRIDVFFVDATVFNDLTGTPSVSPSKPTVNPLTQIELSFVTIAAGATIPTITNEDVYLENTEWVTSSAGTGTFNADSTADPFAGTKSFEATSIQNGGQMIFTRASDIDFTDYDSIGFELKLKANMNNGRNLFVQFFDNADNPISSTLPIPLTKNNSTTYQFSGIQLSSFTVSDITIVRKVKITYNGSGGASVYTGFYADNIIVQLGLTSNPSSLFTQDEIDAVKNANAPTALNPFATIADTASAYRPALHRENNTVLFDDDYVTGINAATRSGNILFDFTGAQLGATTVMRHTDATAFTFPATADLMFASADISTTVANYFLFSIVKTDATQIVHVFHAIEGGV
jgi:hypothetical protein